MSDLRAGGLVHIDGGDLGSSSVSHRPRLGPRPLALHIANAENAWRTRAPQRLASFFQGIRAYRDHPYRRIAKPRSPVWQSGSTKLIDYGPNQGWPIFVVPSLVNRAYVLDLMPGSSLLTFLREGGIRPLLLDWGQPGSRDRECTLDDYILDRLEVAFDWVRQATRRAPLILGYCMGGTLATALACRRSSDCAGLALLATPWDFKKDHPLANCLSADGLGFSKDKLGLSTEGLAFAAASSLVGSMSIDQLQAMFAMLDPMAVPKKFAGFARTSPTSEAASHFVAIEDWLNDGVPLAADLAAQCLIDWYGRNAPALGNWKVDGQNVLPEKLDLPAFLAIPSHDRIVPAASALALAAALPKATIIRPKSGHVGMVTGRKAKMQLWTPLLAWLQEIAAMQKK